MKKALKTFFCLVIALFVLYYLYSYYQTNRGNIVVKNDKVVKDKPTVANVDEYEKSIKSIWARIIKKPEKVDEDSKLKKEVWKKIIANPDSVNLAFTVSKSEKIDLIFTGKLDTGGHNDYVYLPKRISVYKDEKLVQEIGLKKYKLKISSYEYFPAIRLIDLNFDSFPDLQIFNNAGATSNYWFYTWIFNPLTKRFNYNDALSTYSAVDRDTIKELLHTYERFGGDWQLGIILKPLSNNKFDTLRAIYAERFNDSCEYHIQDKINNKWVTVKYFKEKNSQLDNDYYNDPFFIRELKSY